MHVEPRKDTFPVVLLDNKASYNFLTFIFCIYFTKANDYIIEIHSNHPLAKIKIEIPNPQLPTRYYPSLFE